MAEVKETLEYLVEQLKERFERHKKILIYGTKDPNWEDGCGANNVRNHMFYFKSKIEYFCEVNKVDLPSEYFWVIPEEVDPKFVVRKDEILANAKKSLSTYENDENYQYLLRVNPNNVAKEQKEILNNVLGYVPGLKSFIEIQDFVAMRRHEDTERYLDSFRELREKLGDVGELLEIEEFEEEPVQESLVVEEQISSVMPFSIEQVTNKILLGDCLEQLKLIPDKSINCCVTSPPYWGLRDYEVDGQLGLEDTPEEYVEKIVAVFREVKRVLRDDGTIWLVLGDTYAGSGKGQWEHDKGQKESYVATKDSPQCKIPKIPEGMKHKDLVGIPWMVAFALRADGWYLRQDIIWSKPSCMPESVKDRCTGSHEYIFLLSKSRNYYFDADAIKEISISYDKNIRDRDTTKLNNTPGRTPMQGLTRNDYEYRNKRSVWNIAPSHIKDAHFATFPEKLIEPCILAGCPIDGIALDPFIGAGTVAKVAIENGRNYLGIELNPKYINLANNRIKEVQLKLC